MGFPRINMNILSAQSFASKSKEKLYTTRFGCGNFCALIFARNIEAQR
jgi:hypothetical protein